MKGPAATNSTTTPPRAPSNAGTIPLACSGFVEEDSVPSAVGWAFELFTGCGVVAGVGNSVGRNNMEGASVGTGVGASDGTDHAKQYNFAKDWMAARQKKALDRSGGSMATHEGNFKKGLRHNN